MPYYNYVCEKCNERFETWISFKSVDKIDEIPISCTRCGSQKTTRKMPTSTPPVIFKGSGWGKDKKND